MVFQKSIFIILFISAFVVAQEKNRKSVAVTVYNANIGVIKDVREIDVPSGKSEISIRDVAQLIDPTSVHVNLDGEVIEQNYQYDLVSLDKILQKYVDQEIQLISEKGDLLDGKLLSYNNGQVVLQKKEGGLIMLPGTDKYRISVSDLPEGFITKPTLVWQVNSKSSGKQDVEISYQTQGLNWHAEYVAVLNENDTKLDLNSWVSIENNSGASFNNATLKLVAGDINLVQPQRPFALRKDQEAYTLEAAGTQFQEKQFFEYHMYDLQHSTSILNNETKQVSLFEAANVNVEKKFLYRSGDVYRTYSGNNKPKVSVITEFENKQSNNLGMPMPAGKVRLYKSDGKSLEFIGEDMIDHTPKNEKLKLKIGDAFDIIVEEVQTDSKKISDRVSEESYDIKLKNRKKEDIVVEVEKVLGNYWDIVKSTIPGEKKDSQTEIFKVPVKADQEAVLSFRVRYTY